MQAPADTIAETFALGAPVGMVAATTGWGSHNVMWRLETSRGLFAVKQLGREMAREPEARVAIERAAFEGGVPMPQPLAMSDGRSWLEIDGVSFRVHEWADGDAGRNDATTPPRARRMGAVVAHLHGLEIEWPESLAGAPSVFGRAHWDSLVAAGRDQGCSWAGRLADAVDRIVAIEGRDPALDDALRVGSHRDLNAHNVLFDGDDVRLVDWDAAGPASPRFERAIYTVLWSERGDRFDVNVAKEFLRGYLDGGGTIEPDDADVVDAWIDGLVWWTEQNVRLALAAPRDGQAADVTGLIDALVAAPDTTEQRKLFLRDCIATL